uniref:Uncharacterized protein n=1 Tax=Oryza sativa subsp. japonica TaxID=39947 RepID=Q6K4R9_ORYSJ|nr:hypothetical protein [Oryza sativa Japonica Group]
MTLSTLMDAATMAVGTGFPSGARRQWLRCTRAPPLRQRPATGHAAAPDGQVVDAPPQPSSSRRREPPLSRRPAPAAVDAGAAPAAVVLPSIHHPPPAPFVATR